MMALLASGLGAKLLGGVAIVALIGGGLWYVNDHAYNRGHAAAVAAQKAATDKAVAEVQAVANRWADLANKAAAEQVNAESRYERIKGELQKALANHPDRPCLDPDIGDILLNLDASQPVARPQSGPGDQASPDSP